MRITLEQIAESFFSSFLPAKYICREVTFFEQSTKFTDVTVKLG